MKCTNIRVMAVIGLLIILISAGCQSSIPHPSDAATAPGVSFGGIGSPITFDAAPSGEEISTPKNAIPVTYGSADLQYSNIEDLPAPRGTYKNVDGFRVPRPYVAPSAPIGATAQCRDGTYSFSQNRRGACSHHGGVAEWL